MTKVNFFYCLEKIGLPVGQIADDCFMSTAGLSYRVYRSRRDGEPQGLRDINGDGCGIHRGVGFYLQGFRVGSHKHMERIATARAKYEKWLAEWKAKAEQAED